MRKAAADGDLSELKLRLSVSNLVPDEDEVAFKLNGTEICAKSTEPNPEEPSVLMMEFELEAPPLDEGENIVEALLTKGTSDATDPVELVGIELWVRYK